MPQNIIHIGWDGNFWVEYRAPCDAKNLLSILTKSIKFFPWKVLPPPQLCGQSGLSKYLTLTATNFSERTTSGLSINIMIACTGAWWMQSLGRTRRLSKVSTRRTARPWSGTFSGEGKSSSLKQGMKNLPGRPTSIELGKFLLPSSSKWWSGGLVLYQLCTICLSHVWKNLNNPIDRSPDFVNNFRIRL